MRGMHKSPKPLRLKLPMLATSKPPKLLKRRQTQPTLAMHRQLKLHKHKLNGKAITVEEKPVENFFLIQDIIMKRVLIPFNSRSPGLLATA